jgi:hypothetical protein
VHVGPSVVEILEAALFVVREAVCLFASVCPRLEDACGCVASANGVKLKSGGLIERDRGRVGRERWSLRSRTMLW